MKVKIEKMDHSGNGICYIDNKVSFVPKTVIGDIVDVSIIKKNKKYNICRINDIIKKSSIRLDVMCPYYFSCGGCNISNLSYKEQLDFKTSKVKNIFKKYLNMDIDPDIISSPKELKYRNKITIHINNNSIGLVDLDNNIIDINNCLLGSDKINYAYKIIKKEDLSMVNKIIIRECDNGLILNIDGMMNIGNIEKYFLEIYLNNILIYHTDYGYLTVDNLKYLVSKNSFFQVNTHNIKNLYDVVLKYGKFTGNENVVDLYCGVGSISLYVARYVGHVLGIEIVDSAIKDAKINAKINNIENVEFLCSDVIKLDKDKLECDVLIVDPPRIGISKTVINLINNSNINKIIYVSCNPMTLVRDINLFNTYKMDDITLVDMFPQTHHVECVSVLHRKTSLK